MKRSNPESPPPPAFALDDGFHVLPAPAEALADDVTSGGASLDGEPPALAWLSMSLGFPMGQAPLGPVGFRSKALRRALPPCSVFGYGDGRIPASDALCRAPFE